MINNPLLFLLSPFCTLFRGTMLSIAVMIENYTDTDELDCTELHEFIDSVCTACFPNEDPFDAIAIFLQTSIEVILFLEKQFHLTSKFSS